MENAAGIDPAAAAPSQPALKKGAEGKGILFNVGGQTGKDCLLTWADGVEVADRRDRTRNLSLRKPLTTYTTGRRTLPRC